jgi:hypothetical protein
MKENPWARLLAYVTGLVNQELLLKNEYLAAENRILRAHLPTRLRISNPERSTLAEIGKRLGARRRRRWPAWLNQTLFWPGIESSSPRSSMDPNTAAIPGDR